MKSSVKVAYIVPVYNVNKYLDECLSSLKKISTSKEIIIVDDLGSQDPYPIIKPYLEDSNFTYIKNKENMGQGFARNEAIKKVSKDVTHIYFVDSDDYVDCDAIDEAFKLLKSGQTLTHSTFFWVTKKGVQDGKMLNYFEVPSGLTGNSFKLPIMGCATFWDANTARINKFDRRIFEDTPWIINFYKLNQLIDVFDKPTYFYRGRNSSTMNLRPKANYIEAFAKYLNEINEFNFENKDTLYKRLFRQYCDKFFLLPKNERRKELLPKKVLFWSFEWKRATSNIFKKKPNKDYFD